jgi:hypothetical protein
VNILFDHGTPRPLRRFLTGHRITTSAQAGFSELQNGLLLAAAEGVFDLLLTTDKNIRHQQNLRGRRLAILVLPTPDWRVVKLHTETVLAAVNRMRSGEYLELQWSAD